MRERINALPFPLALVAWLNIVLGLLATIAIVFSLLQGNLIDSAAGLVSIGSALLTVGGILQKSRIVRKVVLILNWLSVPFLLSQMVVALALAPLVGLVLLIPASVVGVTLWGLMSLEAKEYFEVYPPLLY